ncbi:MAG: P-loop NTPase fold protein [Prevotella sp.]|nr:P-loop NTPase fold protein [Prevotella sp.]
MNKQIFDFLNEYAKLPSPQYAVLLRGKWGCGKTYFVKHWLAEFDKSDKLPANENSIELKPIYVSLFGMREISDIKSAIDRCVNPFFYSKTGKILKIAGRIASKIIFKTELDIDKDGKSETSFSGALDSLSIFENDNKDEVKGVKFIIFDDLERCQIPMKQLLGFINYFVEHCDCHVVVIGEEKYLDDKTQHDLLEFKEKIVGREFEILPDIEAAIKLFVDEPMMATDFLSKETGMIQLCFECSATHNLRLLRQSLLDFSSLISALPSNLVENNHEYLRSLLACFIAVYAEYRNIDSHAFIVDWENCAVNAYVDTKDEESQKIRNLMGKYNRVNSLNQFEALSSELVPKIVEHIEKGISLASMFEKILSQKSRKLTALERLGSFWDKTNEEFDELFDSLVKELKDGTISEPVNIGKSVGFLGYFDAMHFRELLEETISDIKNRLLDIYQSCTSLKDLFKCHYSFIQGYNYVRGYDQDKMKTKCIMEFIGELFELKKEELPDDMQLALRQLSDENVDNLAYIDDDSYPNHSSNYRMRPIFAKENPHQLFDSLCKMSNRGRNAFSQFLASHYEFHVNCNFADRFQPDHDVLVELRDLVKEEAKSKVSIERWSYDILVEGLDKSIRRANGESKIE